MSCFNDIITRLSDEGNLRRIPTGDQADGVVDLSSNDYLGLALHPGLQAEFFQPHRSDIHTDDIVGIKATCLSSGGIPYA